jgi:hypothetical protein
MAAKRTSSPHQDVPPRANARNAVVGVNARNVVAGAGARNISAAYGTRSDSAAEDTRNYAPRGIAALLAPVLRPAFRKRAPAAAQLLADWPALAGPELAARAAPIKFAAGTLTLACSGPTAMELQVNAQALISMRRSNVYALCSKLPTFRLRHPKSRNERYLRRRQTSPRANWAKLWRVYTKVLNIKIKIGFDSRPEKRLHYM